MKRKITVFIALVLTLLISLLLFNLFTMKNLKTELVINASTEEVWNVLMNHANYPNWNPFIKEITGSTKQGEYLSVTIENMDKKPMQFSPKVLTNTTNHEFRWKGKLFIKGLFDGEHYFILQKIGDDKTKFIHGEHFTGLLSGILINMIGKDTETGFKSMNEALKQYVEKGN